MSQKYRFLLVLGCASLMVFLSMGMRQGMGLFLEPITSALGWIAKPSASQSRGRT